MIRMSVEPWENVRPRVIEVGPMHYRDVMQDDDYDLDLERYDQLAASGVLHCTVARNAARIVGYIGCHVLPHMHARRTIWGMYDSFWLDRMARGPRVSVRLLQASEADLRRRGVQRLWTAVPIGNEADRIFEHLGWQLAERTYTKDLR